MRRLICFLLSIALGASCFSTGFGNPISSGGLSVKNESAAGVTLECRTAPDFNRDFEQFGGGFPVAQDHLRSCALGPDGTVLPAWSRWIEVPPGTTPHVACRIITESVLLDFQPSILPTEGLPTAVNLDPNNHPNLPQYVEGVFPHLSASISEPFTAGQKRFVVLDVFPYRYDQGNSSLIVAENLEVDVTFESSAASPPDNNQRSAAVFRELDRAFSPQPQRDDPPQRQDLLGHYVIVVNNENLLNTIRPLVDWKERMGYKVTVADLGDIGRDREDLQEWLAEGWANWEIPPNFVLLTGDVSGQLMVPYYDDGQQDMASWHASDHQFVCWDDGDSDLETWTAEGFIGRLPATSAAELEGMVSKILAYEQNPYVDGDWVEGGVFIANGVQSCISTNQALVEMMRAVGYERDNLFEAYSLYPQLPDGNIIRNGVNSGVGFVNFRGYQTWGGVTYDMIRSFTNRAMMPVVTGMVCGTNDYTNVWADTQPECRGEAWVRSWQNGPRGGIVCIGPTDLHTHTWFNNTLDGAIYHLMLNRGMRTFGAVVEAAKMWLYATYPSSRQLANGMTVGYYFYSYVLLGDPGLQVWTAEPEAVDVDFLDTAPTGATMFDGWVFDDQGDALPGAYVHVFRKTEDDEVRIGGYTDQEGYVRFQVDPMQPGEYMLTVTGPNIIPQLLDFTVDTAPVYLSLTEAALDDDGEGESQGNGDGVCNPGETIELSTTFINTGGERSDEATVQLASDSPYLRIERGQTVLEATDADEAVSGAQAFLVTIPSETPDGVEIPVTFHVQHGQTDWEEDYTLQVQGYQIELVQVSLLNVEQLVPGASARAAITVENVSETPTAEIRAVLTCSNPRLQISRSEALLGVLTPGRSRTNNEQPFEIIAGGGAYPGETAEFTLRLSDESGRFDQIDFTLTLGGNPTEGPQGPTPYGYWAFDTRDTTGGLHPAYDWVNCGTNRNLNDANDAMTANGVGGQSTTIDLPFTFIYFGVEYRQITISTNGWLAFGRSGLVCWNNQLLGSGLEPPAMVCPYWNDLYNGSVYTQYDVENHRYIVEWRAFQDETGSHRFEVQLYDPANLPTRTGDGEIVFMYHAQDHRFSPGRDVPDESVSIGFTSPNRDDGLTICHARRWDAHTAGLAAGMGLRITTGPILEHGSVVGSVIDAGTREAMERVRVMLDGTGYFGLTDAEGRFSIIDAPVGTYTISAQQRYFNIDSEADIQVLDGEEIEVNFELTHPAFDINIEEISYGLEVDSSGQVGFNVRNDGNGPLDYTITLDYEAQPPGRLTRWDQLFDWPVGDSAVDPGLNGITFDKEFFYISGQLERDETPHKIYVFDKEGRMVRDFNQYTIDSSGSRGYFEMDFNGENILAVEYNNILEITREGELVRSFPAPDRPSQAIAWNPLANTIFTKSITGPNLNELDTIGNMVSSIRLNDEIRYAMAMTWFSEDEDDCNLYLFCHNRFPDDVGGSRLQLSKMNPSTGEFHTLKYFTFEGQDEGDRPQGCVITRHLNPLLWTFVGLINHAPSERLIGWELGPNLTWVRYDPSAGQVPPQENQIFAVNFAANDMPERDYYVVLNFYHNAEGDRFDIPVFFNIGPQPDPDTVNVRDYWLPRSFRLEQPHPNPFNSRARLAYELPFDGLARLEVIDIQGRRVAVLFDEPQRAGSHLADWNGENLAAGIYILRLECNGLVTTAKAALVK